LRAENETNFGQRKEDTSKRRVKKIIADEKNESKGGRSPWKGMGKIESQQQKDYKKGGKERTCRRTKLL